RITRLPRNSLSVTFRPSVLGSENSGAIMPTVRLSPGQSGEPGLADPRRRGVGGGGISSGLPERVVMVGSASNSRVPCMRLPECPEVFPLGIILALPIGEIFAPRAGAFTAFAGAFDFTGVFARATAEDLVLAGALARVFADLADFLLALPFPPVGTDRL